jgi:hypothetical protein
MRLLSRLLTLGCVCSLCAGVVFALRSCPRLGSGAIASANSAQPTAQFVRSCWSGRSLVAAAHTSPSAPVSTVYEQVSHQRDTRPSTQHGHNGRTRVCVVRTRTNHDRPTLDARARSRSFDWHDAARLMKPRNGVTTSESTCVRAPSLVHARAWRQFRTARNECRTTTLNRGHRRCRHARSSTGE